MSKIPHRPWPVLLLVACLGACSGSSDSDAGFEPPIGLSNPVQSYVAQEAALAFVGIAQLRQVVPLLLFPGMHAAAGITFEQDTDPSAGPNDYVFLIPFDSTGDGVKNAEISGTIQCSADPALNVPLGNDFSASVKLTLTNNGGQGLFTADVMMHSNGSDGFSFQGIGHYSDAATGSNASISIHSPATVHTAAGPPDSWPNACHWSVEAQVAVSATTPDGEYFASWGLSHTDDLIFAAQAFYTPSGGEIEPLPDSFFAIDMCQGQGSIQDWAGSYTLDWFCAPDQTDSSALTITVLNSNTIRIVDEHPVGSGTTIQYEAKRSLVDPHVVTGSFEDTDGGGTYQEDFTWYLSDDAQTIYKVSEYLYFSGPGTGSGGDCGGIAARD